MFNRLHLVSVTGFISVIVSVAIWTILLGCSSPQPLTEVKRIRQNAVEQREKPYVVMVSIDGYRFDYTAKFKPPHLTKFAREGVQAEGLIPVYPSKTFPNHYSLATGLYSGRHGIVANTFYDPLRKADYSLRDRKAVEDGTWYGGWPLWLVAETQGLMAASFFWVGSEADIRGQHPTYYNRYDGSVPNEVRVDQVLRWLQMPVEVRPHFITLYFSDVDDAGHKFGPEARETSEAVQKVDAAIGRLLEGLKGVDLPINLIIVSDHGMEALDPKKVEYVDDYADLSAFRILGTGPQMLLYLNEGEDPKRIQETQLKIRKKAKHFRIWKREELPARLGVKENARTGDLIIEVDPPWSVGLRAKSENFTGGTHGYDPKISRNMNGIFYARGPAFASGRQIKAFENIHVYPAVLDILGLETPEPVDGRLEVLKSVLIPKPSR